MLTSWNVIHIRDDQNYMMDLLWLSSLSCFPLIKLVHWRTFQDWVIHEMAPMMIAHQNYKFLKQLFLMLKSPNDLPSFVLFWISWLKRRTWRKGRWRMRLNIMGKRRKRIELIEQWANWEGYIFWDIHCHWLCWKHVRCHMRECY